MHSFQNQMFRDTPCEHGDDKISQTILAKHGKELKLGVKTPIFRPSYLAKILVSIAKIFPEIQKG